MQTEHNNDCIKVCEISFTIHFYTLRPEHYIVNLKKVCTNQYIIVILQPEILKGSSHEGAERFCDPICGAEGRDS